MERCGAEAWGGGMHAGGVDGAAGVQSGESRGVVCWVP